MMRELLVRSIGPYPDGNGGLIWSTLTDTGRSGHVARIELHKGWGWKIGFRIYDESPEIYVPQRYLDPIIALIGTGSQLKQNGDRNEQVTFVPENQSAIKILFDDKLFGRIVQVIPHNRNWWALVIDATQGVEAYNNRGGMIKFVPPSVLVACAQHMDLLSNRRN